MFYYLDGTVAEILPGLAVIDCGGVKIGRGEKIAVMAGPCSIESEEQITYCAQRVKAAGASLLRDGAFSHTLFSGRLNLQPGYEYMRLISWGSYGRAAYLFFGNIAWFMPLGMLQLA